MLKRFLNKSLRFQIMFTIIIVISVPAAVTAWNILAPANVSKTIKSMHEEMLVNLLNYFEEAVTKEEINNLKNNSTNFSKIQESFMTKLKPNTRFINGTKIGLYTVFDNKNNILINLRKDNEFKEFKEFKAILPSNDMERDIQEEINETIKAGTAKTYYKTYPKIEMLRYMRPISLNGEIIAVAWDEVMLPTNINMVKRTISYTLLFVFFSLILGLFLMITILKNLNKNIIKISKGLETISNDLSFRIEDMGGDLGKVADSINNMTSILQEKDKLEEQLARADKLASLGHMISGVAHEIRNPLSIIRGTVQLMERDFKGIEGIDEYVKIIKEQSDRENRVIQELLDYARPSRQILSELNINFIIQSVLAFTNKYMQDRRVKLELSFEENLPNIFIDGDKIKQVFVNIIINACEAMENGGTLYISTQRDENWINICFRDTGIGIDESQIKSIFNPYYSTKPKGTGLGLSISNNIIEMHNGSIEATSTKGEGTTFVVKLPFKIKEDRADE